LNTSDRLANRGITQEATCPFGCQTTAYLFVQCPHTSFLWHNLPITSMQGLRTIQDMITNPRLVQQLVRNQWLTIYIAVAWTIWLTRNHRVFDRVSILVDIMQENCQELIKLWANRSNKLDRREAIKEWAASLVL
jgi:hypothetical protein